MMPSKAHRRVLPALHVVLALQLALPLEAGRNLCRMSAYCHGKKPLPEQSPATKHTCMSVIAIMGRGDARAVRWMME